MLLHSVLVSSFLLASAVLADNNKASGGVMFTSLDHGTFSSITTTIEVPPVTGKPQDAAAAFVSLDDTDCPISIQAGISFIVNQHPMAPTYQAWLQIRPSGYQLLNQSTFPVLAGTNVTFGITVHSVSNFSVHFENHNIRNSRTLDGVEHEYEICGNKVEWGMSSIPYPDNPSYYPDVCNFGILKFVNATAHGPTGTLYLPQDEQAKVLYMSLDNDTTVAETRVDKKSINFTYVYDEIP